MTPTLPSSSNSFSPPDHLTANNSFRVVRKRNRVPLSCGPCRNRKLKCNRQTPCGNCVRRHDAQSCTYATNAHSVRSRKTFVAEGSSSSDEVQSRIDRLEGLVLSLMSGNSKNVSPRNHDTRSSSSGGAIYTESHDGDEEGEDDAMGYGKHEELEQEGPAEKQCLDAEVEEVRNALGIMKVYGGKSFYRGETHWAAVLMEIKEVKKHFDDTKQKYEQELAAMRCETAIARRQATGFPFSASPPPTMREILNLVPKKPVVDLLVDAYFRNHEPLFLVVHRPSFFKQYEDFWRDPSQADVIWIGLLMVILSIAVKICHASGEPPVGLSVGDPLEMWLAFRNASEQCLIIGDYTKKLYLHTIQALLLLCVSASEDNSWLLLGSVIRLAMMMGLHRDPGQFSAIPAGEGELRRRLWTQITCMDLLTSIHIGLPSMIKEDECDTQLPRNLHDDEVGEGITTLQPERGNETPTGVCYMITKASMLHALWEIIRQVNSVSARPPYEQVLKLEAEINARHQQIPSFLRLKSIEDSVNDPAWLIIQRYSLSLLHQMSKLTLHRPYAARVRSTPRYAHSYYQCVDAAMTLLKHQDAIFTQGTTVLRHARWYTDSHRIHEFLHAAMVVSLDLSDPHQFSASDPEERKRKFAALYRAREIHESFKADNVDASRAFDVITVMLDKLNRNEPMRQTPAQPPPPSSFDRRLASISGSCLSHLSATDTPSTSLPEPLKSEQAAALTLGMMSGGGLTPNSAFDLLFDRPVVSTPGGTLHLPDVPAPVPSQTTQVASPGWNSLWGSGASGFEMPSGLEWDEWGEFMKGIDLDTSQLNGYPVLPGIGMFPSNAAQEKLEKSREKPGGGAG